MKQLQLFLIACTFGIFFVGCSDAVDTPTQTTQKKENLVDLKDGHYTEWYPGRKQIKYQGQLNEAGNREGKWDFFSETGNLQSFTMYVDGKKEGHSLVKYPNGKVHYYGSYQNDQMVGEWVNYDQKGNKSIKNYGEPK
ncbi:MAG: toxin-antitoxin system YwqK family antitoxin [Flavobacteriales bacterium]